MEQYNAVCNFIESLSTQEKSVALFILLREYSEPLREITKAEPQNIKEARAVYAAKEELRVVERICSELVFDF